DEHRVAALERLRPGDPATLLVGAAVPDDHAALPRLAFEIVVGLLVVLDLHREPFLRRVHRGAFRHRPGAHHAVDLEPQVPVVGGRFVLLDDEDPGADPADRELLVAFDLALGDLDLLDPRPGRSLAEPPDQRVDRLVGP